MIAGAPSNRPQVWAIGPVPPPVTGMTLFTERVVRRLKDAGPVVHCNWSHGRPKITRYAHALRVFRTLGCAWRLLRNGRVREGRLYLTSNSRSGLRLTYLLVFVGRRLGYRVFLHHHTYGYISRYNRWMARIDRNMDDDCVHIVSSQHMVDNFRKQYQSNCSFTVIFPSVVSLELGRPRVASATPFRLGMLSNLTIEKGAGLAIDTFRRLHDSGCEVTLELAGPIFFRDATTLIDNAVKSHPNRVRHAGPVYGDAKVQFLNRIDGLLFPTKYEDESWGIVLHEAFAAGVPVITFDRGFTKTVVGKDAGLIIDPAADFAEAAAAQVRRWIEDPNEYQRASEAAIEQADYLSREGERMLDAFAACFISEAKK
jgi:glycosyltransferase involved in cell wall biosynthesis